MIDGGGGNAGSLGGVGGVGGGDNYRLARMEADFRDLQRVIGNLGDRLDTRFERMAAQMEALKNEVQTSKLAMPDTYVTRREANERWDNLVQDTVRRAQQVDARIDAANARIAQLEDGARRLLYAVVGSFVAGAIGLVFSLARAGIKIG